ncbi:hypothetical protein LguiA_012377 [Lonicera macranthoides]
MGIEDYSRVELKQNGIVLLNSSSVHTMATDPFLSHRNQVNHNSLCIPSKIRHGHSKAQICLMKILHTISSFSPSNSTHKHEGLDLNIRLCEETESPADGEVCDEIVQNWCESDSLTVVANENGEESELVEETPNVQVPSIELDDKVCDEIVENENGEESETNQLQETVQFRSSEFDDNGTLVEPKTEVEESRIEEQNHQHKQFRGDDCMNLLIDAAKLIFGGSGDEESQPVVHESAGESGKSSRGLKRTGNIEETSSPVVRSKRGRSRVLPYKYRDSILEPLARLSRHRSTTTSSKRRSR